MNPLYPTAPGNQTAKDAADTLRATSEGFIAGTQVGGWVAGIVLAVVQGLVELIENVTSAKVRKTQAVEWARQLGIPNPEEMPGFIVSVQAMNLQQRIAAGVEITNRLGRTQPGKMYDNLYYRRAVIALLIRLDQQRAAQAIPPAAPASTLYVKYVAAPAVTSSSVLPFALLAGAAGIGWVLLT